ncbi:uncharacterized protein LOC34617565 [Cyclospora cayetanensis]|uniref:tyrosine--tRNA ligase n=1 Tax=Cyclospora cayetanensis TaxID=88456 RepID=A0A6P6RYR0_9EIME|nr:uncharacterized protein LOC34617565 [Cyclospora cayetanensis]
MSAAAPRMQPTAAADATASVAAAVAAQKNWPSAARTTRAFLLSGSKATKATALPSPTPLPPDAATDADLAAAGRLWEPANATLRDLLQRRLLANVSDMKALEALLATPPPPDSGGSANAACAGVSAKRALSEQPPPLSEAVPHVHVRQFPLYTPHDGSGGSNEAEGTAPAVSFYMGIDMTGPSLHAGQKQQAPLPTPLVVQNDTWLDSIPLGAFLACAARRLPLADILPRSMAKGAERHFKPEPATAAPARAPSGSCGEAPLAPGDFTAPVEVAAADVRKQKQHQQEEAQQQQQGQGQQQQQLLGVGTAAATAADIGYALLQALDFVLLARCLRCYCQIGGRDQWKNISTGLHVARRLLQEQPQYRHSAQQLVGVTTELMEGPGGIKMGKNAAPAGAPLWLCPSRCSPVDFWQNCRNTGDQDIQRMLLWFSDRPAQEILMDTRDESPANINRLKVAFADELTLLVHGEEGLQRAHAAASLLSRHRGSSITGKEARTGDSSGSNQNSSSNTTTPTANDGASSLPVELLPTHFISSADFAEEQGPALPRVMRAVSLAASALEASRLMRGGAVRLNGEKVTDPNRRLMLFDFKQQKPPEGQAPALAVLTVAKNRVAALAVKESESRGPSPHIWGASEGRNTH